LIVGLGQEIKQPRTPSTAGGLIVGLGELHQKSRRARSIK